MKLINLFKNIPFLLTLIFIVLLSISNQKQYTRLKILIWNTPSLSLGNYLAISTGTGFIISYIVTNNLAKDKKIINKKELKYKVDNQKQEINSTQKTINEIPYDKTFIERDVKDPSPTINASFRIISNSNRKNVSLNKNEYDIYNSPDDEYYDEEVIYKNNQEKSSILNDWEDYSYTDW